MRVLVTGVAGFVGSHLAERLLATGHDVVGVDCFTDYYARDIKERNVSVALAHPRFSFVEADLAVCDLAPLYEGVTAVFHQAAQAGVRASWGQSFDDYTRFNVLATQRLLEAARGRDLERFVYASSSSVYGQTTDLPMREDGRTRPFSPYGVTKLAAEHLAELYRQNFGVPTASLRYFTVYGPRQRPDMGFHKFIVRALRGEPIVVFGDGQQTRDFTYVSDIVDANVACLERRAEGVFNVGGGSRVTLAHVLEVLEKVVGRPVVVTRGDRQAGDVEHTEADTARAAHELGFAPRVGLEDGLRAQVESLR